MKKTNKINPQLLLDLKTRNHSLGNHPIFPETINNTNFEENMFIERFDAVHNRCKTAFGKDNITTEDIISIGSSLLPEVISIEREHKAELEDLAVKTIMREFDIMPDDMEIIAELTTNIDISKLRKTPDNSSMEFDTYDEVVNAAKEVKKRRFINSLIQGSAKKCNHMFHMIDDELNAIDYRLMGNYNKIMCGADYSYFLFDDSTPSFPGGLVAVILPKDNNGKIKIHAKGITLPVLLHELVKGVMEVISLHGLPTNDKLCKFVMSKADYTDSEFWDMRIGVGLWEKFTALIEPVDFHLKHHIFCDLVELPVDEFTLKMREIMGGTNKGKRIINSIVHKIKEDIKYDNIEHSLYDDDNGDDDGIDLNNFDFTKYL